MIVVFKLNNQNVFKPNTEMMFNWSLFNWFGAWVGGGGGGAAGGCAGPHPFLHRGCSLPSAGQGGT